MTIEISSQTEGDTRRYQSILNPGQEQTYRYQNIIPQSQFGYRPRRNGNCLFCTKEGHYWKECYSCQRNGPTWKPVQNANEIGSIVKIIESEFNERRQPQIDVKFNDPSNNE